MDDKKFKPQFKKKIMTVESSTKSLAAIAMAAVASNYQLLL